MIKLTILLLLICGYQCYSEVGNVFLIYNQTQCLESSPANYITLASKSSISNTYDIILKNQNGYNYNFKANDKGIYYFEQPLNYDDWQICFKTQINNLNVDYLIFYIDVKTCDVNYVLYFLNSIILFSLILGIGILALIIYAIRRKMSNSIQYQPQVQYMGPVPDNSVYYTYYQPNQAIL